MYAATIMRQFNQMIKNQFCNKKWSNCRVISDSGCLHRE